MHSNVIALDNSSSFVFNPISLFNQNGNTDKNELSSAVEEKPNYLERCVKSLDLSTEQNHAFQEKIWKVASIVTLVASIILAGAAFVCTGLFYPILLPVVAVTVFLLLDPAYQLYKNFDNYSHEAKKLKEQSQDIRVEYEKIPSTSAELEQELQKIGIYKANILDSTVREDVTKLRPILAHYNYWKNLTDTLKTKAEEKHQAAISKANELPDEEALISEMRDEALLFDRAALIAKTNAAFMYGLLKIPNFQKELKDFATENKMSFEQRIKALNFNDQNANNFLTFKGSAKAITFDEILHSTIPQIAERIFTAATAA